MRSVTMKGGILASLVIGNAVIAIESVLGQEIGATGGWASFGIAGLVLAWLLLVYLPAKDRQSQTQADAKDKQMKELMDRFDSERNQDRTERHARYGEYQATLNRQYIAYEENLRRQNEQHKVDADNDRKAFLDRQERTESVIDKAIAIQTQELKAMITQIAENNRKAFLDRQEKAEAASDKALALHTQDMKTFITEMMRALKPEKSNG